MTPATLADLRMIASTTPGGLVTVELLLADSYESWVDLIERGLDNIISILGENPELRQEREEDEITIEIISMLRIHPLNVAHEAKVGGHADIVVRGKENWLWIAEAKKHTNNYSWIFQGFQQLSTRYSTGTQAQSRGALLIYTYQANTLRMMQRWKEHLKDGEPDVTICPRREGNLIDFVSRLPHERTGLAFSVTHTALSLFFNPKDH